MADVTDVAPIALLSEAGITVQEMTALVTETEPVYRALDKTGLVIHHGIAEMSLAREYTAQRTSLLMPNGQDCLPPTPVRFDTDLQDAEVQRPQSLTATHAISGTTQPRATTARLADGRERARLAADHPACSAGDCGFRVGRLHS